MAEVQEAGPDRAYPKAAYARAFAQAGWRVFRAHWITADGKCSCADGGACDSAGKHPCHKGWQKAATTDTKLIRRWWKETPDANIGILCGKGSNITVVDVDGAIGCDRLRELEEEHGALPPTPTAISGSGGLHKFFIYTPELNNAVRWDVGLDIRTEGGLIIGAGSINKNGGYHWEIGYELGPQLRPPPMPEWLVKAIKAGQANGTAHKANDCAGPGFEVPEEPIAKGAGRNSFLYKAGRSLKAKKFPPEAIRAALAELNAKRCDPPVDEVEFEKILRSVQSQGDRPGFVGKGEKTHAYQRTRKEPSPPQDGWKTPENISPELLPVPRMSLYLIPQGFRNWIADIAERQQCPMEFPIVAALVAASAVVGRSLCIRPKREDDWQVVPNVWGAVIGRAGVLKTPALEEGLFPINRFRSEAEAKFKADQIDYKFKDAVNNARKDDLAKRMRAALKEGKDPEWLKAEFEQTLDQKPVEKRYMTNDTTVEKLGELLNENPRGLLVYRDELTGFLRTLERQGREGDRAFYLEAWNGNGKFDYDRIMRGTVHIGATCVALLGGIQPAPLEAYFRETFADGRDDGLIQRLQLAVYPNIEGEWVNVDRKPNEGARQAAIAIFRALDNLDSAALGAITEDGKPPFVRFTAEAQTLFDEWRTALEKRLRSPDEHPIIVAHLSKYRSLMPSLALLFELIDGFAGPERWECVMDGRIVSEESGLLAAAWCEFLEAHARRITKVSFSSCRTSSPPWLIKYAQENYPTLSLPAPYIETSGPA